MVHVSWLQLGIFCDLGRNSWLQSLVTLRLPRAYFNALLQVNAVVTSMLSIQSTGETTYNKSVFKHTCSEAVLYSFWPAISVSRLTWLLVSLFGRMTRAVSLEDCAHVNGGQNCYVAIQRISRPNFVFVAWLRPSQSEEALSMRQPVYRAVHVKYFARGWKHEL